MAQQTRNMVRNGWNLERTGGSEVFVNHIANGKREFVARFKYFKPGACATHFINFLTANFTPAEYFALRDTGMSPLPILESKGYVSYHLSR
jgi:hypothetical protein